MNDPPLIVTNFSLTGRYNPPDKKLLMEKGDMSNATGALSFSGLFDFGVPVPYIQLKALGSRMPSATVKRFWPVTLAPPARLRIGEPLRRNGRRTSSTSNGLGPHRPEGRAAARGCGAPRHDSVRHHAAGGEGIAAPGQCAAVGGGDRPHRAGEHSRGHRFTPQNRKLAVSDGVFYIPDYFPREPSGLVRVKFDGPADAGIEVLGMMR